MSTTTIEQYQWTIQPEPANFVKKFVEQFTRDCPPAAMLARRMRDETGTRLVDWIDHLALPNDGANRDRLAALGFESEIDKGRDIWRHSAGLFPAVMLHADRKRGIAIRVDSVLDFLAAHHLDDVEISGRSLSRLRKARVWTVGDAECWAIERHGDRGFDPLAISAEETHAVVTHSEAFRRRKRRFAREECGFEHTSKLILEAAEDLGVDWVCDLFFAAERDYWQRRNRAARVQKARQDALGLGWANHDHHTYRSSREHFTKLIAVLEQLGFICRERFYGGREAGWGAQVLEQPTCGIVIFADVDLTPDEVTGDFAHEGLAPQSKLGTVGLWCKLHGEAMLQAGLHHLECQFDFDSAREQLLREGVRSMKPFSNFAFLKQSFTEGEIWPVDESRIDAALSGGFITPEQAEQFRRKGAIGSHLEILERNDGYKGFNQTGISEIIAETDPRRASAPSK